MAGNETAGAESFAAPPKARAVRAYMFALATESGPRLLAFQIGNLLIGRLPDNHLALNHSSVSRRHARIAVTPTGVTIEDMQSQNGTTVNGTPTQGATPIRPGDVLRIGHVPVFYFGFIVPDEPPVMEMIQSAISVNPTLPAL
ncbi:FHA domain-containing protein [Candidatus Poribacteria bacterium]|nr:FHA domain-containing protein [Candidatus Poribacteria bacterium]